jgi:hypothetical protein
MKMANVIKLRNVSFTYEHRYILEGIDRLLSSSCCWVF